MPGTFTFTVEPTAELVISGLLSHAWMLAALLFLAGLLFGSSMLRQDDD